MLFVSALLSHRCISALDVYFGWKHLRGQKCYLPVLLHVCLDNTTSLKRARICWASLHVWADSTYWPPKPQQLAILETCWFLQPSRGLSPAQDMQLTPANSTSTPTWGINFNFNPHIITKMHLVSSTTYKLVTFLLSNCSTINLKHALSSNMVVFCITVPEIKILRAAVTSQTEGCFKVTL